MVSQKASTASANRAVGNRRNHLATDELDVIIGAAGEFRRQRVRGKQRRADIDANLGSDAPGGTQQLALGFGIETVA
jgi:hypothetical protein